LNYRGYIKFQQNQIQRDLNYLAGQVRTPEDLVPTARQVRLSLLQLRSLNVDNFMLTNLYMLGGFTAGSMIGYSFA